MASFYDNYQQPLDDYVRLSYVSGSRSDYVQGGGGNTSAKLDGNLMAIKASGYLLRDVAPENAYAVLDYKLLQDFYAGHQPSDFADIEKVGAEQTKAAIREFPGLPVLRPSVEAGFHSVLKRFVSHTHSVYANLACCSTACVEIVTKALMDAPYSWGWVAYHNPGSNLTFAIRDEMRRVEEEDGCAPAVFFMQNHGLIVQSDDADECLRIQEDVNQRLAAYFSLSMDDYPAVAVQELEPGLYETDIPWLEAAFRTGKYTREQLVYQPLCPDQMVFLVGTYEDDPDALAPDTCATDLTTGKVRLRMSEKKAMVIAEVLTATLFIQETISAAGFDCSFMDEAAKDFVANWESEKYRKSLADK